MGCIVGVDGGNTKTVALVAAENGTIVGQARGGCSDIYGASSEEAALEELRQVINGALREAGYQRADIISACYSLAGADWPEDYVYLQQVLKSEGFGDKIAVYNDALGALRAGTKDGVGVVIACGTGVATAARNADGEFWHTSFWQEPLCGVELGRQALSSVTRSALGIDPPTSLTGPVLAAFGVSSVEGLLRRFTQRGVAHPHNTEVSKLAPILLREAEAGDPLAVQIVEEHGRRLAEYALAAARKVHLDKTQFSLVLNGGIFKHSGPALVNAIIQHIAADYPEVTWTHSRYEPAIGALLLAFDALTSPLTDEIMNAITSSLPPDDLFMT